MTRYVTTILRFPEETYLELRQQASRRGLAMADLVRDAVARYLGREEAAAEADADPIDALVGCIASDRDHPVPDDESVNHDHCLYGWPREGEHEAPGGHERPAGAVPEGRPAPTPPPRRSWRDTAAARTSS